MKQTHIILLDNLDSFTYNLVDEIRTQGYQVTIYRNTLSADYIYSQIQALKESAVVLLSPGPGAPKDAGCMMDLIALCRGNTPMLGICLGHQALIEHYGGEIVSAGDIIHGKSSLVTHDGHGPFKGLPNPLQVARYHSLMGTKIPDSLSITAKYQDIVMSISDPKDKILGFQFHPESILTTDGSQLLSQSIQFLTEQ